MGKKHQNRELSSGNSPSRPCPSPYLLQRGEVREMKVGLKVSEFLSLDYMGSAEFEFGALPKAMRAMDALRDHMVMTKIGDVWFLALPGEAEAYAEALKTKRLKEYASVQEIIKGKSLMAVYRYRKDDFWLDVGESPVAMALKKDHLRYFLQALTNSVRYMDEQKKRA